MYGMRYREELPPSVVKELDDFFAWLGGYLGISLNDDGTVRTGGLHGSDEAVLSIMQQIENAEGHWWRKGPWIFDNTNSYVAYLRPPVAPSGASYNNYSPDGFDTCIGVLQNISGDITITGLKAPVDGRRRLLIFQNQSLTSTDFITLKHDSSSSLFGNRFSLPGAMDIELGPRQTVWLIYDAENKVWESIVTGQASGGISGANIRLVKFTFGSPTVGAIARQTCPVTGTIVRARIYSDIAGSAVVDIWKDTWAHYPPTVGDSIINTGAGGVKPTLSGVNNNEYTTFANWTTTTVTAGDAIFANVDSVTTCTEINVELWIQES